jgi:ankyrin repeat protein
MPNLTQDQLNERLFQAIRKGDLEAVKKAIEAGADVNAEDEDGRTLLHTAALRGHTEIAKVLIKAGVKYINARNEFGFTPLDYAFWGKNKETITLLKQHGGVAGWEHKELNDEERTSSNNMGVCNV